MKSLDLADRYKSIHGFRAGKYKQWVQKTMKCKWYRTSGTSVNKNGNSLQQLVCEWMLYLPYKHLSFAWRYPRPTVSLHFVTLACIFSVAGVMLCSLSHKWVWKEHRILALPHPCFYYSFFFLPLHFPLVLSTILWAGIRLLLLSVVSLDPLCSHKAYFQIPVARGYW